MRTLPYNREVKGESLRSAFAGWKHGSVHCLEAAFLAAAILEKRGYPPLVMSLESVDRLDHVIYVFKEKSGWGSIARSRDEGLHGRAPVFRSLRELTWSYFDPYVDKSGRIRGYGMANLDDIGVRWRDGTRNLWQAEQHLIHMPHVRIKSSNVRYRKLLAAYHRNGPLLKGPNWW